MRGGARGAGGAGGARGAPERLLAEVGREVGEALEPHVVVQRAAAVPARRGLRERVVRDGTPRGGEVRPNFGRRLEEKNGEVVAERLEPANLRRSRRG